MKKSQIKKITQYRKGYVRGYFEKALSTAQKRERFSDSDYMRGYYAGRRDKEDGEQAEFHR